jgi:hypothetical protein
MKTPGQFRVALGARTGVPTFAWFKPALVISLVLVCCLRAAPVAYSQSGQPDAEVVQSDYLNLRTAPTTASEVIGVLPPGTPLRVVSATSDRSWLQVESPAGQVGWVFAQYVVLHIDLSAAFPEGGLSLRLPDAVAAHVRQVYAAGQARGNHANVFAKVGDSITVSILYLNPIGDGLYTLGDYGYLQGVIDFYASGETRDGHNSFNETPIAARVGWTTYRVLSPDEGDAAICRSDESPLVCEYRVLRPSVALIMFGTNDVGVLDPASYRANLERIVELSEARGIIAILSTIPPREGYDARVAAFNGIVTDVARQHTLPLVDYGSAMQALGRDGLDLDHVHPSPPPKGYEGAADFRAQNLHYGYVIRNLTALQMLDAVWRVTQNQD